MPMTASWPSSKSRPIRRHAGQTRLCLASMGIYVFETSFLIGMLRQRRGRIPDSTP